MQFQAAIAPAGIGLQLKPISKRRIQSTVVYASASVGSICDFNLFVLSLSLNLDFVSCLELVMAQIKI